MKQDSFGDPNTVSIRPDIVWIPVTVPEAMNGRSLTCMDVYQASVYLLAATPSFQAR